ncbi:NACHT domain-containing protein [Microbispora hainanensis]|uniref:NACHT domain-containing protein n=1 Tax=Microbispora hainanensis TaxID=568844 RepID=UPI00340F4FA9
MPLDFSNALLGALVQWLGGPAGRRIRHLTLGPPACHALSKIITNAADPAVRQVTPPQNVDSMLAGLREHLAYRLDVDPAAMSDPGAVVRAWLAPLTTESELLSGTSYLGAHGVDGDALARALEQQITLGVLADAMNGGPLAPLAQELAAAERERRAVERDEGFAAVLASIRDRTEAALAILQQSLKEPYSWVDDYVRSLRSNLESWRTGFISLRIRTAERVREEKQTVLLPDEQVLLQAFRSLEPPSRPVTLDALALLSDRQRGNIALVGGPGAGKSTLLDRIALALADRCAEDSVQPLPVVVPLRHLDGSVLDLIRDVFLRYGCRVSDADVRELLAGRRLLVLLDGMNELSSARSRATLSAFLDTYRPPVIATGRDPLDCALIRDAAVFMVLPLDRSRAKSFTAARLGDGSAAFWKGASAEAASLSSVPLMLMMLCTIYRERGELPTRLGSTLRWFDQIYAGRLKMDARVDDDVRLWWSRVLGVLAHEMTANDGSLEPSLTIDKEQAVEAAARYLFGRVPGASGLAMRTLDALQRHHFLAQATGRLQFAHQVLQDYYAAEHLLRILPGLDDKTVCATYLNLLKWTECLITLIGISGDPAIESRLVRLACTKVDIMLGVKLGAAGGDQAQRLAIGFVAGLPVKRDVARLSFTDGSWLDWPSGAYEKKLELLSLTRSIHAVPHLMSAFDSDEVRLL